MEYTISKLTGSYNDFYHDYEENENKYLNNYREEPKQQLQNAVPNNEKPKKKVSFDDILTNMNLVVNKKGELQRMDLKEAPQYQEHPYQEHQQQPLHRELTQSYIYNKYFKDYSRANTEPVAPRVPKTMEEYKQMLLDDKINALEHKKRMEQIKPKKMMFTSAPYVINKPSNIQASKNNLKRMSFI
jgi:hypothetical protein